MSLVTKQRKAAGTKRELLEVHLRRDQGYVAFRTPASMGVCDVIAIAASDAVVVRSAFEDWPLSRVLLIECKANSGNPFMHFRKPEREALILAAKVAGATPLLVHHPPNGERREIPVEDWPA